MIRSLKSILLTAMIVAAGAMATTSCTDYQDEIDALDYRVNTLES